MGSERNHSIKCKKILNWKLQKDSDQFWATTAIQSGGDYAVTVSGDSINNGNEIHSYVPGYSASPDPVLELPEYKHPPTKPEGGESGGESGE